MKLKLRPLEETDAHTSVNWRNDHDIWRYTTFAPTAPVSIEAELKWAQEVIADPAGRRFAILVDDVYVGNVYLTHIEDDEAEFGIFIGNKEYRGRGIARAASTQIIDYARKELKLRTIRLGVSEANIAAMKIYKSLGFKEYAQKDGFIWMRTELGAED